MSTIIIFDLDDTLVNQRMKIPRQTYHMLNRFKKLGYFIGIITYNWMVYLIAKETNLYKYTNWIFYEDIDRDILFEKCITQIINNNEIISPSKIYYVDDRKDNLEVVKESNKNVISYHCNNMYKLYEIKHFIK